MVIPNPVAVAILESASFVASVVAPLVASLRPVRVDRDVAVPTWTNGQTLVDVYTPSGARPSTGWPVMVLFHGGGFRFFSKDSHALVAAKLCEVGFIVVCADYRLAPKHPFPLGLVDALSAYGWAARNAELLGGDPRQLSICGESAGANFALAVSLVASRVVPPPVPFERHVVSSWPVPLRTIVQGGYLQASATDRFASDPAISPLVYQRTRQIQANYLPDSWPTSKRTDWGLADPLCIIEGLTTAPPKFPSVLIPVGENDPVLGDSRRLANAMARLRMAHLLVEYPRAPHALYALPFSAQYDPCWRDIKAFLTSTAA